MTVAALERFCSVNFESQADFSYVHFVVSVPKANAHMMIGTIPLAFPAASPSQAY